MRNLVALTVGVLSLCCALSPSTAQEPAGTSSGASDTCVYKLELTEEMIQELRNGATFHSAIPAEWRNRVTHVELKIVSNQHSAGFAEKQDDNGGIFLGKQNLPVNQATSGTPNFTGSQNFPTNTENNLPGFSNNTRTDSLSPRPSPTNMIPSAALPPDSPFSAAPSNTTANGGIANSVLSTTTSTLNQGLSRYEQPLGPPMPNSLPINNPPQSSPLTLPPMNSNGFQPAQSGSSTPGFRSTTTETANPSLNQNGFPTSPNYTTETMTGNNSGWRPPAQSPITSGNQFESQANSTTPPWKQPNPLTDQQRLNTSDTNRLVGFDQPRQTNIPGYDVPRVEQQPPRVALAPVTQPVTQPAAQEFQITNPPLIATNNEATAGSEAPQENTTGANPVAQLNQFNSFLYFLLLCSIGLNLYLGWISRGFYGRYRELADELRDAFSTSV